jgi:hypothetical protein
MHRLTILVCMFPFVQLSQNHKNIQAKWHFYKSGLKLFVLTHMGLLQCCVSAIVHIAIMHESHYSLKCDSSIATKSNILPLWVSLHTIFNETHFSLTTTEDISYHILVCDRFCMKLIKSGKELLLQEGYATKVMR